MDLLTLRPVPAGAALPVCSGPGCGFRHVARRASAISRRLRLRASGSPGLFLASRLLGIDRLLDPRRAADVRLDGRDPVPHASCRKNSSTASRPGCGGSPDGLLHVNILACGIFGSGLGLLRRDLRDGLQDRVAGTQAARLRRERIAIGSPRHLGHPRHPHPALHHHGGLCGGGRDLSIIRVFIAGCLPGLIVMLPCSAPIS